MRPLRGLILLTLALMTGLAAAATSTVDPTHSPACLQALAALDAEESTARPASAGDIQAEVSAANRARIQRLQKFAAGTCLGAWMDAPPPASRALQAPMHVSPVPGLVMRAVPLPGAAPSAVRPAAPQPNPAIASCTPGGCITSDGQWVARGSGVLLGPDAVYNAKRPGH